MVLLERILNPRNETISTSRDLDLFLREGSLETDSGVSVSGERDVLKVSAAYAAVRIVSNTVSQVPLVMYRRTDDGRQLPVKPSEHKVARLLSRPNVLQHNMRFRKSLQAQLLLRNESYAIKVLRPDGSVSELLPIHGSRVIPEAVKGATEFDLQYKVTLGSQDDRRVKTFPSNEILHLVGESTDGIIGLNPTSGLRNVFGLALATERHGSRLFKNGAQFSGTVSHPKTLSDAAHKHLKESFRDEYQGVDNAFNVLILEEAMTWEKSGMTAEESQFLQTRKFQAIEVARVFGVPPHLLFELDRATFNNIEHLSLEFVKYFIQAHWENWEQQLSFSLLKDDAERDEFFFEHDATRLLRGDTKAVTEQEVRHVQWGIRSRQEIRREHKWDDIEGLDEPLTPANMKEESDDNEDEPKSDGQIPPADQG